VEFLLVFEQEKGEVIQTYACRGTGGIGDEVGDVTGAEREDELAEFHREAEEEAGRDGSADRDVQHFQIDAEREEEKDVQQNFIDVEADADVAVIIKGDEVEASRTIRVEHFCNFTEGEGGFEEDAPYDEQAVEEKQDVGEGEFSVP
jgi:hypothetical protein